MKAIRPRLRAFALAGIVGTVLFAFVVTGSACSKDGAAISGAPEAGQAVVQIPAPGAATAYTAPRLPERGPAMPPDTIPLDTLYQQGAADVLRGLLAPANSPK